MMTTKEVAPFLSVEVFRFPLLQSLPFSPILVLRILLILLRFLQLLLLYV